MDFQLCDEQTLIVDTVRNFLEKEIYPHEKLVEETGVVPKELGVEIAKKCKEIGFFAANFPSELGGGGLNHLEFTLLERELGRGSNALTIFFGRPSGILMACNEQQKEKYLFPAIKGEKFDALAMTEPGAGSDVRGMECTAQKKNGDWIVNGTKHFISHADIADFIIVFIATGKKKQLKVKRRKSPVFLLTEAPPDLKYVRDITQYLTEDIRIAS